MQVRNDLRSQGLEVPDAVARPAASPDLALAALREVENQPHAGRQHKTEEPEISDDDEDVEQEGDIGGRYEEEIMEVWISNATLQDVHQWLHRIPLVANTVCSFVEVCLHLHWQCAS